MPEPRVLHGRYELGDLIGAGGSARVHRAHDRILDRVVAVKLLDAAAAQSADPAAHDRFLREARTSAGFAHRHSVSTYDAGDADGQLFLVMEFVDGPSLARRIADEAPMAESEIVRVGGQVLAALGAAHAAGLIHRDVKPANILLDTAGDAKLADFGIAKRFDELSESLTVAGMVIGTRDYLAPEQAAGAEIGPPVDLFALGVVMYEMATGVRPPRPPDGAATGPDPRSLRPDLSDAVATTIATALAAGPRDRFASAAAMAASLTGELPPTELSVVTPRRSTPETLTMPAAGVATSTATGAGATSPTAGPARGGRTTSVLAPTPPDRSTQGPSPRWLLIAASVLVVLVATIVLANRTPDESTAADGTGSDTTVVAQLAAAPPASASVPTSAPEATVPPTTVPPTTPASTTLPPTTPPTGELIPGFAATDDLDTFIAQLRDAKDVAGKQAKKVGDRLEDVRDDDAPGRRRKRIDELRDDLAKWVDKGELEPAIAARTNEFLDSFA